MAESILPDLPEWLSSLLPPLSDPLVLTVGERVGRTSYEKALKLAWPPNGYPIQFFDSLEEAHQRAHRANAEEGLDLFVEPIVAEFLGEKDGLFLTYPTSHNTHAWVMSYTDQDRLEHLRVGYKSFLEAAERYRSDPSDFAHAYNFIDLHPAFWTADNFSSTRWHWTQSGYCSQDLTHWVDKVSRDNFSDAELTSQKVRNLLGRNYVRLEAGATCPTNHLGELSYDSHYSDWRLQVDGPTFEEAFVLLAQRVGSLFNDDGSERPEGLEELGLREPSWMETIRKRIEDYDQESLES